MSLQDRPAYVSFAEMAFRQKREASLLPPLGDWSLMSENDKREYVKKVKRDTLDKAFWVKSAFI